MVISDGGMHFIDKRFHLYLKSHGIHHNVATPDHPQRSGQVETSNKQIKNILQKTVDEMGTVWRDRLHEALWAYVLPTRHHWVCHHTNWCRVRLAIYL
jgi:hypothetical protein